MALPGLTTGDLYVVDLSEPGGGAPTIVESLRGEHILELAGGFAKTALLTGRGVAQKASPGSSEAEAFEALSGLNEMLAQKNNALRESASEVEALQRDVAALAAKIPKPGERKNRGPTGTRCPRRIGHATNPFLEAPLSPPQRG